MNKLSAVFAAAFCLVATGQAKATVNQAGSLLWTADLPGLATDVSVIPVVLFANYLSSNFANSYGEGNGSWVAFRGSVGYPGWIATGVAAGPIVPGSGLATTTNYIESSGGGPITMTPNVSAQSVPVRYLGFLTQKTSSFNVTFYDDSTVLGEITAAQLDTAASANGYAWINVDVANGFGYTSVVLSETNPNTDVDRMFYISFGPASESIGPESVPLPALAGTIPGFAAVVIGMLGLRRSRGIRS
jgi:hypothetical protein